MGVREFALTFKGINGIVGVADSPARQSGAPARIRRLSDRAVAIVHGDVPAANELLEEHFSDVAAEWTLDQLDPALETKLYERALQRFPQKEITFLLAGIDQNNQQRLLGWNSQRKDNRIREFGNAAPSFPNPIANFLGHKIYEYNIALENSIGIAVYILTQTKSLGLAEMDDFVEIVTITGKEGVRILQRNQVDAQLKRVTELHAQLLVTCSDLFTR